MLEEGVPISINEPPSLTLMSFIASSSFTREERYGDEQHLVPLECGLCAEVFD